MKKLMRAVLAVQALTLAASAQAGMFDTVGAFVYQRLTAPYVNEVYTNTTQPVSGTASTHSPDWDYFPPYGTGVASVWGQAGVGSAHLELTASGDGFGSLAAAGWTDQIVVSATGQAAGTHGTVSFQIRYDWSASAEANPMGLAYATPYVDVNFKPVGGAWNSGQYVGVDESLSHDCYNSSPCSNSDEWYTEHFGTSEPTFANGVATVSLNVVFGQAYFITVAINESLIGGNAAASANGAMFWNGIQTVTANGQAVENYAISSAIGLDYKVAVAAVPEPGSVFMFSTGLVLLVAARRRRR